MQTRDCVKEQEGYHKVMVLHNASSITSANGYFEDISEEHISINLIQTKHNESYLGKRRHMQHFYHDF